MTSAATVRRAGPGDAAGLVAAHEAGWDATVAPIVGRRIGELAPLEARVERARESLAAAPDEAAAWVAERDEEVVGMAVVLGAELRDLYVAPGAWGTGVAAQLLDAALAQMRSRRIAEAQLWVGEANARARRFYEREGWAADGGRRDSPLGPPELRYTRSLAA